MNLSEQYVLSSTAEAVHFACALDDPASDLLARMTIEKIAYKSKPRKSKVEA